MRRVSQHSFAIICIFSFELSRLPFDLGDYFDDDNIYTFVVVDNKHNNKSFELRGVVSRNSITSNRVQLGVAS